MTENTTSMTLNECEVELQRKRESVVAYTLMFHKQCEFLLEHYLSHILEMEPVERVKYIVNNFTLRHASYDDAPDDYAIFCGDNELNTLVRYCQKCFPGYKITHENDETIAVYITKILSKEELYQLKILEEFGRLQQNIKFKQDELCKLHLREKELETSLETVSKS